jgi:exosome complex RNA-binding protein Rrp4
VKAFKMIEEQAHTSKLTDRINIMLQEETAKLKGTQSARVEDETVDSEKEDSN